MSVTEIMEAEGFIPYSAWPVPTEWPLYVSVQRAADIAGVSYELMSEWVNATSNPIPHIRSGRKKLIRVSAIPEYMEAKERK